MRIYLNGDGPRVERLKLLLAAAGHEITPAIATAKAWLCCQPLGFQGARERHQTQQMIMEHCRDFTGPGVLCLVTMEPNDLWPANYCHITENTLRNSGHSWQVTRAHFRTPLPERSSELILGANKEREVDTLREIFGPASDLPAPLAVERVFAAELAAENAKTFHQATGNLQ